MVRRRQRNLLGQVTRHGWPTWPTIGQFNWGLSLHCYSACSFGWPLYGLLVVFLKSRIAALCVPRCDKKQNQSVSWGVAWRQERPLSVDRLLPNNTPAQSGLLRMTRLRRR